MSKLSIYETGWINLVFENRNKEYGAYQLRRDYVKSSLTALFVGLTFVILLGLLSRISWSSSASLKPEITTPPIIDEILTVTDVYIPEINNDVLPNVASQTTEIPITKDNLVNPKITSSSDVLPEIVTNKQITNQTTSSSEGQVDVPLNPNSGSGKSVEISKPTLDANAIVSAKAVDKLPEFPGGIEKFYTYVGNNFEKPVIDNSESIRVVVNFIIERDGSMTGIQVKNDPGQGIGYEAIRVLKSLKTKWKPGLVDSKPVRTAYSLPIIIQLE